MFPNQHCSRIDTFELKAQIVKKIGHQRAEKYFNHLKRLFSSKITKSEFDKLCVRTIGRETIPLHNQLIRSILRNACIAKDPPYKKLEGGKILAKDSNVHQRSSLKSLYGDAFPSSPRKGRSPVCRDRKFKDRPSPLGPLGKPQSMTSEELAASKQQSATELLSLGSRPPIEVASVEDGEEVEQIAGSPGVQSRSPVTAPLGVLVNLGGPHKTTPSTSLIGNSSHGEICQNSGFLSNTQSLRSLLMHKLDNEGLKVSLDCVNLLNNGLDSYLKRLIEPCLSFARSRQENNRSKQINFQAGSSTNRLVPAVPDYVHASTLDFRAAMEMNPQILGQYWSTHLERICSRTLDG
ncbi:uncharacterized protein LOC116204469 [Punica granatum]|uniref:Transcriptional coactivator Hfi1/Transcriptional adapter 1 n=2 Tax=Punica granatum TaxID=22663 RepID=A0A218VX02_PUNGR|nr:uncharacterized protein LOC116204469 [Punica granatum]OWM64799.1 hypothetical protein CDL15_Pgr028516 [Punica granatum]PKI71649.1 hypothetical protein CRG98_007972 [Punica granatum]